MISGSSSTTRMRLRGAVVMRPPSARPTRGSAAGLRAGGDWRAASDRDHGENRSTTGARARVGDGDAPTQGGRSMGIGGWIFRAAGAPGGAEAMRGLAQAEAGLAGALGRLFAVVEAYPQLKANENMLAIQEELTSTENRIAFARQGYNDSVMEYNIRRETFPANFIANVFAFTQAEQLQSTESPEERKTPRVSFS